MMFHALPLLPAPLRRIIAALGMGITRLETVWHQFTQRPLPISARTLLIPLTNTHRCSTVSPHGLQTFLERNPLLVPHKSNIAHAIQPLLEHIEKGVIPPLPDLVRYFPANDDSRHARQLLERVTYFLSETGEAGRLRSEQLRVALQLKRRKKQHLQIQDAYFRYNWDGGKAKEISASLRHLETIIEQTEGLLIPLLEQDPSRGDAILLNPPVPSLKKWLSWLMQRRSRRQGTV